MRILVIGATGYIGSHVASVLNAAGHEVSALRRPGRERAGSPAYGVVVGDLARPDELAAAASGFGLVVHVGAPISDDVDLAGAEALVESGSPVLYTTGAAVLGSGDADEDSPPDPHPLAAGRPAVERVVLDSGGWVVRPGLVYGDGGGLVHGLLAGKAAERGTGVYIGPPGTRWPVVHIDDLAALYPAVIANAAPGTVWHGMADTVRLDAIATALGGGKAVSWPLEEATAELGPLADLFTRDQNISSARTRTVLNWKPVHTSMIHDLTAQISTSGTAEAEDQG